MGRHGVSFALWIAKHGTYGVRVYNSCYLSTHHLSHTHHQCGPFKRTDVKEQVDQPPSRTNRWVISSSMGPLATCGNLGVLILFVGVLKAHGQQVSSSFLQLAAFLALLLLRLKMGGIPKIWPKNREKDVLNISKP